MLTSCSDKSARTSSSSLTFRELTKPSTKVQSLACLSLAILACKSISSNPCSNEAKGSSSSSSSPSQELFDNLECSISAPTPSSEPASLSSLSLIVPSL